MRYQWNIPVDDDLTVLRNDLAALRETVRKGRRSLLSNWRGLLHRRAFAPDLANLAAYVSFRRQDLRGLQPRLAELGLSSLGRCESHVLPTLDAVLAALDAMLGRTAESGGLRGTASAIRTGEKRLGAHASQLLGPAPARRHTRIMVTLPTRAAEDGRVVRELIARGMDLARINCAHDDPEVWGGMVEQVRAAAGEADRSCRIMMDLAGPKLRTGEMVAQPPRLRVKPKRDAGGNSRMPAHVLFDAGGAPGGPGARNGTGLARHPRVCVAPDWLRRLLPGDLVELVDARSRKRQFQVVETTGEQQVLASVAETVWLEPGIELTHVALDGRKREGPRRCRVGPIESQSEVLTVHVDDLFLLARDAAPGAPAQPGQGAEPYAGHIPCAQPEVLDYLRPGERVFVDDGRVGAQVEWVDAMGAWLRITRAGPDGERIRPGKGLNFPDSDLALPALTDKDRADLDFVVRHADLVGYSFVQAGADMDVLADELQARGAGGMGVVAKIETRKALTNLPEIMVHGAGRLPFGVMIARGDLAVEIGWERMAEIQEEILWLAEAARVPVIWATQVLEQLIKEQLPSRAEMTDAAMSERAECVMLNKGPYVLDAVAALDDIAVRMHAHQRKKSALLRALHW